MGASVRFPFDKNKTPCCQSLFIPDPERNSVRCRACYKEYRKDFPQQNARANVGMGQYQGLRGTGLIVLDATAHQNIVEYDDEKDAQGQAARMAQYSGCAIVYAPVAIVRPEIGNVSIEAPRTLSKMLRKVLPRDTKTP